MSDLYTRLEPAILHIWTTDRVRLLKWNCNKRSIILIWILLVLRLGIEVVLPDLAIAQGSTWNQPVQLHSTDSDVYDPILLSDESGRLHLFWNEVIEEVGESAGQSQIYYMVKDEDTWSGPVDVLSLPKGFTNGLRGSVDKYGRPFLVVGGVNSALQYSHAFHPDALTALEWQPLKGLTDLQVGGEISIGNAIHVVYGDIEGQINYLRLEENGNVKSSQVIAWLPGNQLLIRPPRMILTEDGTLHVVLPAITPPDGDLGSYYLRSADSGESWTELTSISHPDRLAFSLAEDSSGHLHVLFAGRAGAGGRYHIVSEDGGKSWSDPKPITLPEKGSGLSGGDYALDSANHLHAVFGLANDAIVVHSEFNGANWSDFEVISQGVSGTLEKMEIEITQGNRLHAVWQNDHNSIWYAEGIADAPSVKPEGIIPEPSSERLPQASLVEATPEQVAAVPTAPYSLPDSVLQAQPDEVTGATSLLIATTVSLLFIGLVITLRYLLNRR